MAINLQLVCVTSLKPNPDVRTGRHVVHNLHVHLVFVTKYRRKAFTDKMVNLTRP
ncbi:transposase [Streptomyces sp. NBC_01361]|uniref:transposase n=1 Tax=Streptomyces sp. NBC_01361 TaxID=2903838 RepID=UPI003FCD8EF5